MSPSRPSDLTVACHVRPSLVFEPIDAKIETLRRCEREGRIDALLLRSWPDEVALTEGTPHEAVRERADRFEQWADRAGVSVFPPFERRETSSVASDRIVERLVTPTICLACYDDDRLVGVFPHTDGETTHTVPEAIASLRTGSLPQPLGSARTADVPEPLAAPGGTGTTADTTATAGAVDSCPDCDATAVNVQGTLDCPDCEWHAGSPETPLVNH